MSDEKAAPEAPKPKSSFMKMLISLLVVLLVAAGGGLGVFLFVLKPILSGEAEKQKEGEEDKIPETAKTVELNDDMVHVLSDEKPAPLLSYRVSLKCSNEETAHLVEADKAYFEEMVANLHSYKRREELDDPLVKESIKREALKKANERLEKLEHEPNPENKILEVFHTKFMVVDQ